MTRAILCAIVLIAVMFTAVSVLVMDESEQAAWNAHCVRDNTSESAIQECIDGYSPKVAVR